MLSTIKLDELIMRAKTENIEPRLKNQTIIVIIRNIVITKIKPIGLSLTNANGVVINL